MTSTTAMRSSRRTTVELRRCRRVIRWRRTCALLSVLGLWTGAPDAVADTGLPAGGVPGVQVPDLTYARALAKVAAERVHALLPDSTCRPDTAPFSSDAPGRN